LIAEKKLPEVEVTQRKDHLDGRSPSKNYEEFNLSFFTKNERPDGRTPFDQNPPPGKRPTRVKGGLRFSYERGLRRFSSREKSPPSIRKGDGKKENPKKSSCEMMSECRGEEISTRASRGSKREGCAHLSWGGGSETSNPHRLIKGREGFSAKNYCWNIE